MKSYAKEAIFHEPNSRFAHVISDTQIQVRIQTKKNDMTSVEVLFADVYNWKPVAGVHRWQPSSTLMTKRFSDDVCDYYVANLDVPSTRFKYAFVFDGNVVYGQLGLYDGPREENHVHNYFTFPYINQTDQPYRPSWLTGLTWYQIFVDRFASTTPKLDWTTTSVNNQMIFGGNLQGIIEKLEYLSNLGIQGLYLNPIFDSPTAHKYDTTDYYKIDPSFGNMEDLKQLVNLAHQRGIKVMLDGVFNHAGFQHAFFQDVIKHQTKSKYYDYFLIDSFPIERTSSNGKPSYRTFAYASNMPKWNTNNPKVIEYLSDIALFYAKEINIDGWRMDVSEEPSRALWQAMNAKIRPLNPDFFMLAENWYDANSWLTNGQFDSVMNYTYMFTLVDYFKGIIPAAIAVERLHQLLWRYSDAILHQLFNIIDTHDTARIKTILPLHYNAVIGLVFAMPGTPSVYYGTEAGMIGEHDPDCRRPMTWHAVDQSQYTFLQRLIQFRSKPVAQQVDIQFWNEGNTIYFKKPTNESLIGFISTDNVVAVPLIFQGKQAYDVLQDKPILLDQTINLSNFIGLYLLEERQ
jgi:glycosidase